MRVFFIDFTTEHRGFFFIDFTTEFAAEFTGVVITTGGREWKGGARRGGGGGVWANGREAAVGFWRGCVCVCVCVGVGLKGVPGMKVCGHNADVC